MSKLVWLDLEETIINNWQDGLLLLPHVHKIRRWLIRHEVTEVNIWSFAIYNVADKKEFIDTGMLRSIEVCLDVKIVHYPSVDDMQKLVYHYEKTKYDSRTEFMSMNGKFWSFLKYCMGWQIGKHCVLIDDAVPNWIMKDDKGTIIETINIKDLKV